MKLKVPLILIPITLGHYKGYAVNFCLSLIKDYIGEITLILFDREFYDKDLMYELSKSRYPYLIFVLEYKDKKEILNQMDEGKRK